MQEGWAGAAFPKQAGRGLPVKSRFNDQMDRGSNAAPKTGKQGGKTFLIRRRSE